MISITGVILFGLNLVFKNYKKRQDRKNAAEKLILEYKLIALKAQVNPHFVSNCLSALQNLVIGNQLNKAATYIAKFGLLVRHILNFSTRSFITLTEELEIASLYVELEQLRFEHRFEYILDLDNSLNMDKIFVPALILNPIVENAIWHGLLPLKAQRPAKLIIRVLKKNDNIQLIIEDNGVGKKQVSGKVTVKRESKGISLTEQRLVNTNFLLKNDASSIQCIDLADESGSPNGTRVIITLPDNLNFVEDE